MPNVASSHEPLSRLALAEGPPKERARLRRSSSEGDAPEVRPKKSFWQKLQEQSLRRKEVTKVTYASPDEAAAVTGYGEPRSWLQSKKDAASDDTRKRDDTVISSIFIS